MFVMVHSHCAHSLVEPCLCLDGQSYYENTCNIIRNVCTILKSSSSIVTVMLYPQLFEFYGEVTA